MHHLPLVLSCLHVFRLLLVKWRHNFIIANILNFLRELTSAAGAMPRMRLLLLLLKVVDVLGGALRLCVATEVNLTARLIRHHCSRRIIHKQANSSITLSRARLLLIITRTSLRVGALLFLNHELLARIRIYVVVQVAVLGLGG